MHRLVALLETEWVLRSRYKLGKGEILGAFSALLSSVDLSFEDEAAIEEALFVWQDSGAQFADCLIGARYRALGGDATATFESQLHAAHRSMQFRCGMPRDPLFPSG